jgi:hypothetical protein
MISVIEQYCESVDILMTIVKRSQNVRWPLAM